MNQLIKFSHRLAKPLICGLLAVLFAFRFCVIFVHAAPAVYEHQTGKEQVRELTATIDTSYISEGYVMCRYSGTADKALVQVSKAESKRPYNYHIGTNGKFEAIPFTQGDGLYTVRVYAHIGNGTYRQAAESNVTIKLDNPFLPFLYPNRMVNFSARSVAVTKGDELATDADFPLEIVENVYNFLAENVKYDYDLAASVRPNYISDADKTLETGKGICLDYAVLAAVMLRSQGIPTRVVCGRMGDDSLHAWISFYSDEAGVLNGEIEIEAKSWNLLDPTYAAANEARAAAYRTAASFGDEYRAMYNF